MRQGLRLQVAHSPVGNGIHQNTHTNAGLEIHAASDMLFSRTFKEQGGKTVFL